jgi:hypothetical protein
MPEPDMYDEDDDYHELACAYLPAYIPTYMQTCMSSTIHGGEPLGVRVCIHVVEMYVHV